MKTRFAVLIVSMLACQALLAQSKPEPNPSWDQEPTSVFGIQFGKPLLSSVAECPKITQFGMTRYEWVGVGHPCFGTEYGLTQVYNVPNFFDVYVTEIGGSVESISAAFNNGNSPSYATLDSAGMASALIQRFGAPHSDLTETVRTRAGVPYPNRTLAWRGKNISIDFRSVDEQFDHGALYAYTKLFAARNARNHDQDVNSAARTF
jgi:hypothetical protein